MYIYIYCFNNFITFKLFNAFRSMFNSKPIQIYCYIIFNINSNPIIPTDLQSSRFITYAPYIILDKLFLE